MKTYFTLVVCLMVYVVISCNSAHSPESKFEAPITEAAIPEVSNFDLNNNQNSEVFVERKLIRTGSMRFRANNLEDTHKKITQTVKLYKGMIVNDNSFNSERSKEHNMEVKIPAENLDNFINDIDKFADKLDYKKIGVLDVSEQYADGMARLKTKKELENRYLELLKKATKVEEMLKVEEQLSNVRFEIESIERHMFSIDTQVQYSSLNISFYENKNSIVFKQKVLNAFSNGLSVLQWVIIALINLWAVIVFALLISSLINLLAKKRRRNNNHK